MSVTRKSFPRVGEDITVDPRIEASGKIRLRSAEAAEVARMFGLGRAVRNRKRHGTPTARAEVRAELAPGTITLITGASGAGKSSLLRKLRAEQQTQRQREWIDLAAVELAEVPIVNCFGGEKLIDVLRRLGRVGQIGRAHV